MIGPMYQRFTPRAKARKSSHIGQQGSASKLSSSAQIVRVKHVVGFARENWGEGNWTGRDLR